MRRLTTVAASMAVAMGVPGLAIAAHTWSATDSNGGGYVQAQSIVAPTLGTATCTKITGNWTVKIPWTAPSIANQTTVLVYRNDSATGTSTTANPYVEQLSSGGTYTYQLASISKGAGTWTGTKSSAVTVTFHSAPPASCAVS